VGESREEIAGGHTRGDSRRICVRGNSRRIK